MFCQPVNQQAAQPDPLAAPVALPEPHAPPVVPAVKLPEPPVAEDVAMEDVAAAVPVAAPVNLPLAPKKKTKRRKKSGPSPETILRKQAAYDKEYNKSLSEQPGNFDRAHARASFAKTRA